MSRLLLILLATTASIAIAQPPNQRGERPSRQTNAVLAAIDADGNHEITTVEMKNAFDSLKALDTNKDGKLSRDEIHPEMAGGGRGRPNDERAGRQRGGGNHSDVAERMQRLDKNNDGSISKDEVPARMEQMVARFDANKNGTLDKEEVASMVKQLSADASAQGRGGPGAGRPEPGGHGPIGQGREGQGPGGRAGGGPGTQGPGGRGAHGPSGREGGLGGPPTPEQFVSEALEFDSNKDGKLSKEELREFAEQHARHGPPGEGPDNRGGPGFGGGPRVGGREGGGANRPQRPARPE